MILKLKETDVIALTNFNSDPVVALSNLSEDAHEATKDLTLLQLLELARRVKSQAGAKYFGVPVGSLITPDMEDDAKASHAGRAAPPNAVTGSNQKRAGTSEDKTKMSTSTEGKSTGSGGWAAKGFKTPTISGPIPVLVGKEKFSAPEGSSIFKSPKHSGRVYVVTPNGETHVITANGELNLTPAERQSLTSEVRQKFEEVVQGEEQEEVAVTWIRLKSIFDMLEQAEEAGDTSQVKKLLKEFREAANAYDERQDSRELRTRIKNTKGS
jgi:hypothetical protein